MKIRRLAPGEEDFWIKAVAAILTEEVHEGSFASESEITQSLADFRCCLLIDEESSQNIGLLNAYRFPDVAAGGELVYQYDIEAQSSHRGKGISAAMIRSLIEHCRKKGVKRI